MLNPYPLRSRSNSNPPRPYTALLKRKQQQLEKQKHDAELAEARAEALGDLPPRPPRNTARQSRQSVVLDSSDHLPAAAIIKSSASTHRRPATSPGSKGSFQPQFSTLDRTILRELRRSILARSSQFKMKHDQKHHPYRADQVPYPRSYDSDCVDCDVWETVFCKQFSGSVTWHVFDTPPAKVLDIGCGTGSWVVECARKWKDSHFVGLDIVPLHPDLGNSNLGRRITWVQSNFLEALPFPNEEFDFVHIKRIARGVPEDKWDFLFEEITRVMKPGASFEMLEEDLYIPGRIRETMPGTPSSSNTTLDSASSVSDAGTHLTTPNSVYSERSSSTPHIVLPGSELSLPQSAISRSASEKVPRKYASSHTISTSPTPSALKPPKRPASASTTASTASTRSAFSIGGLLAKLAEPQAPPPMPKGKTGAGTNYVSSAAMAYPAFGASLGFSQKKKGSSSSGSSSGSPSISQRSSKSSSRSSSTQTPAGNKKPVRKTSKSSLNIQGSNEVDEYPMRSPAGFSDRVFDLRRESIQSSRASIQSSRSSFMSLGSTAEEILDIGADFMEETGSFTARSDVRNSHSSKDDRLQALLTALETNPTSFHPDGSPRYSVASSHFSTSTPTEYVSQPLRNSHLYPTALTSPSTVTLTSNSYTNSSNTHPSCASPRPSFNIPPGNPREHKLLETIYAEMHAARFVNLEPLSLLENYLGMYFKDVRTHAPLIFTFPPPLATSSSTLEAIKLNAESVAAELEDIEFDRIHDAAYDHDRDSILSGRSVRDRDRDSIFSTSLEYDGRSIVSSKFYNDRDSFMSDDRDSIFSARLNNDTDSVRTARFSNKRDSAFWSIHEEDEFPSPPVSPPLRAPTPYQPTPPILTPSMKEFPLNDDRSQTLTQEFSSIFTRPSVKSASSYTDSAKSRNSYILSAKELMSGASDYVVVDKSRVSAFSPRGNIASARANRRPDSIGPNTHGEEFGAKLPSIDVEDYSQTSIEGSARAGGNALARLKTVQQVNMLPNQNIEMDLRTLNLHLHARVAEVLACAESMWEWIVEFQAKEREKQSRKLWPPVKGDNSMKANQSMDDFGSIGSFGAMLSSSSDPSERLGPEVKRELMEMTRERFNEIMTWFRYDMDDNVALGAAVHSQFGWQSFTPQRTEDRTAFDLACARWETYQAEKLGNSHHRMSKEDCPIPRTPPTKRLSRTLRVFVAWKA